MLDIFLNILLSNVNPDQSVVETNQDWGLPCFPSKNPKVWKANECWKTNKELEPHFWLWNRNTLTRLAKTNSSGVLLLKSLFFFSNENMKCKLYSFPLQCKNGKTQDYRREWAWLFKARNKKESLRFKMKKYLKRPQLNARATKHFVSSARS